MKASDPAPTWVERTVPAIIPRIECWMSSKTVIDSAPTRASAPSVSNFR